MASTSRVSNIFHHIINQLKNHPVHLTTSFVHVGGLSNKNQLSIRMATGHPGIALD